MKFSKFAVGNAQFVTTSPNPSGGMTAARAIAANETVANCAQAGT